MEALYLRALVHWYRHRTKPPTIVQLCDLLRRSGRPGEAGHQERVSADWPSIGALRRGLVSLEAKGYIQRNSKGKFEVIK